MLDGAARVSANNIKAADLVKQVVPKRARTGAPSRGDHRTASAARKRQRTRMRLLDATLHVCAEFGSKAVVIEDILAAAAVSRGTFYAHFDSLYAAMAAVAERLAEEMHAHLSMLYRDLDDPVLRLTTGFQAFLRRAWIEPLWGSAFAASRDFSASILTDVGRDFIRARQAGALRFKDLRAAMDLHLGASIQAARALQGMTEGQAAYIEEIATLDLIALGVPRHRAIRAVRWAADDLQTRALKGSTWPAVDKGTSEAAAARRGSRV
jgi:AcrR family transcriptional regulator